MLAFLRSKLLLEGWRRIPAELAEQREQLAAKDAQLLRRNACIASLRQCCADLQQQLNMAFRACHDLERQLCEVTRERDRLMARLMVMVPSPLTRRPGQQPNGL